MGFTDAPSVAGGVPDGTVGIADNCRLIAIRRGGTEADYADMYIWVGGFNTNSTRRGFPAQLARGADIITNSFGFSTGSPISGLMRDTFDHLTTYGRGGKGILLFFSAGNQGGGGCSGAISTLLRPWGSYEKCMSISASTFANDGATWDYLRQCVVISALVLHFVLQVITIVLGDTIHQQFMEHGPVQFKRGK